MEFLEVEKYGLYELSRNDMMQTNGGQHVDKDSFLYKLGYAIGKTVGETVAATFVAAKLFVGAFPK